MNGRSARILVVTHIKQLWSAKQTGSSYAIRTLFDFLREKYNTDIYCTKYVVSRPSKDINLIIGQSFIRYFFEIVLNNISKYIFRAKYSRPLILQGETTFCKREVAGFKKRIRTQDYDLIIFEYLHNHHLAQCVDRQNTKIIIDTHDIMHKRFETLSNYGITSSSDICEEQELELLDSYDMVLAIQEDERRYLEKALPGRSLLVKRPAIIAPLPLDAILTKPKLDVSFIGSESAHNVDALKWFLTEIWNSELSKQVHFNIYGDISASVSGDVQTLGPSISVHGRINNLETAYLNTHLVINPVRAGSGLKIKNVEALGYGRPVLTTSLGAKGLENCVGRSIFVKDSENAFRGELLRLSEQRKVISQASAAAIEDARNYFSADVCFGELKAYIDNVVETDI